MAMPTSVTVEVEFTAGVWTDVTTYLDGQAGGSTKFGRTSPFGAPGPGTLTLTLANDDGRFTPGRQVLADGVTVHPYYPNVLPRKRVRVAYVVSGTPYYRFTGYIKGWPPAMVNGDTARVTITATTRDDRMSRVGLEHLVVDEHNAQLATAGGRGALYLMSDTIRGATSGTFVEKNGGPSLTTSPASTVYFTSNSTGLSSTPLPASDGLQCLSLSNGVLNAAGYLTSFDGSNFAVSGWMTIPVLNSGNSIATLGACSIFVQSATNLVQLSVAYPATPSGALSAGAAVLANGVQLGSTLTGSVPNDSLPHHYLATCTTSGGTQTLALFVDGSSVGTTSFAAGQLVDPTQWAMSVGGTASTDVSFQNLPVIIGPTSVFSGGTYSVGALATALNGAGRGFSGDSTDGRLVRLLGYAGLTSSDWTLDAGVATMASQSVAGVDVVTLMQQVAVTEGGGAAAYVGTDGKMQFRSRTFRKPGAPAVTLDAEADLDASTFAPAFDDMLIVNQVQGSRGTAAGVATTQTVNDSASQTTYGLTSSSFTSFATTDADVLANARDQLAQQRNPAYQLPQVTVDLATATTAGLYAAVAGTSIGSRLRLTNLPPGAAPATQADLYIEGWADAFSTDNYSVTFDLSPADNPAWGIWDDATYGRWQCSGQTLNAGITAVATTLAIATTGSGNPTFTTDATMYPLTIQIGAEQITLTAAPGGSASPQTFTGVTRGVNGTTAAAQAGGASVDLAPASTWTL